MDIWTCRKKNGHTIGHIYVVWSQQHVATSDSSMISIYDGERFIYCFDSHSILQPLEKELYGRRLVLLFFGSFLHCLNAWQTRLRTFLYNTKTATKFDWKSNFLPRNQVFECICVSFGPFHDLRQNNQSPLLLSHIVQVKSTWQSFFYGSSIFFTCSLGVPHNVFGFSFGVCASIVNGKSW